MKVGFDPTPWCMLESREREMMTKKKKTLSLQCNFPVLCNYFLCFSFSLSLFDLLVAEERVFTGKQERNNEEIKLQTQTIKERRKKINIEHKNLFLILHTNKPNKHENIGYKKLHEPTN